MFLIPVHRNRFCTSVWDTVTNYNLSINFGNPMRNLINVNTALNYTGPTERERFVIQV